MSARRGTRRRDGGGGFAFQYAEHFMISRGVEPNVNCVEGGV